MNREELLTPTYSRRAFGKMLLSLAVLGPLFYQAHPIEAMASQGENLGGPRNLQNLTWLNPRVTRQFDKNQYPDLTESEARHEATNSCGMATLATTFKLYQALLGSQPNHSPSVTIESVKKTVEASGKTYLDPLSGVERRFFQWDGSMYFRDLIYAYQQFGFSIISIFGDQVDDGEQQLLSYDLAQFLQPQIDQVLNAGGLILAFSTIYNGHFLLLPKFVAQPSEENAELIVADSRGWDKKGLVKETTTEAYSPFPATMELDGQPTTVKTTGMLGLVGILPPRAQDLVAMQNLLLNH